MCATGNVFFESMSAQFRAQNYFFQLNGDRSDTTIARGR